MQKNLTLVMIYRHQHRLCCPHKPSKHTTLQNAVPFPIFRSLRVLARHCAVSPCPPARDCKRDRSPILYTHSINLITKIALFHYTGTGHHQSPPLRCRVGINAARVEAGTRCIRRTTRDGVAAEGEDQPPQVESRGQAGAAHGLGAGADAAALLLKEDGRCRGEDHSRREMERGQQQREYLALVVRILCYGLLSIIGR